MAIAAAETATSLVAFTLPSSPYSVQMARIYVRAALSYHDLGEYAGDAETVASELATNAITHVSAPSFDLELKRVGDSSAVMVIVTDASPDPPVMRAPAGDFEHGRGLQVVQALSASWGWTPHDPGKAVYAIFTKEA